MNIFDTLEKTANDHPERVALVAGSQVLSYRALVWGTAGIAQRFSEAGVVANDVVMLRSSDPMSHLLLTLALARLGAISMPGPQGVPLGDLMQRCGAKAVVLAQLPGPQDGLPPQTRVLTEAAMLAPVPARPGTFQTLSVASETPWRIALSSGTTGRSKAVAWTHGASLACWPTTVEPFAPMAETDRVLVFMDISNTFAIHRILRVFGGAATLVLPLNASPQELVRCIDLYGATQVITVTSLAVKLLAHLQQQPGKPGLRFHALNLLLVGGEPISQPAHRALRSRVCPNLVVTYGTSECGPIATADADLLCANPRATGRLLPATQAQALSDSGEALPPGQLGRLRFRTPGMVTAYLGDPDKSAEAFVDGWYQSRDMGFVDEAGIVWLGARSEEWLALGTETIDPQRLEAVISALPGVREAVVFLATQTGTPPVLVALYAAEGPIATAQVRQHCIDQLDARLVPDYFGQVNEIPRTANGKISRRELGQRFKVDAKPDAATAVAAPPAA